MKRYNPKDVEPKWAKIWDETGIYTTDLDSRRPKYIGMSMFNYPSGAGIHIGHAMNYTISDVKARFKRQQGYESYHPVGWDAFGLPAENYAIKTGVSPQESMATIIPGYHKQYKAMGWSNDWEKEIATHLPEYYKWSQWIFAEMYRRGLVYQDSRMQWWCPIDNTVLANEQVIDGKCWRHDGANDPPATKKEIKQWFFKITDYADELLEATDELDWTESVKLAQKNWIGKSAGAEIEFVIGNNYAVKDSLKFTPELTELIQAGKKWSTIRLEAKKLKAGDYAKLITRFSSVKTSGFAIARIKNVRAMRLKDVPLDLEGHERYDTEAQKLADYKKYYGKTVTLETEFTIYDFEVVSDIVTVFTTRADTIFGATFLVLAPEHELVQQITTKEQKKKVDKYVKKTLAKSELERQENKEKTGVFTGANAINPATGGKIPIWIADYVLTGYGTGAIMAVPAHDERDREFARKFNLPITPVVEPVFGKEQGNEFHKNSIIALVHSPKTDEFLVLDWGPRRERWGGNLFVGGGVDDGEDIVEAAKREIEEETGYSEVELIAQAKVRGHSYYYSNVKDRNDHAYCTGLLFDLLSDDQKEQSLDEGEKNKFKVKWVKKEDIPRVVDEAGLHNWFFNELVLQDVYTDEGIMTNSGKYDGMASSAAREKIVVDLAKNGVAEEKINYRMRDWSVSRQRYWGAPIPIVNCPKCGPQLVKDEDLPVVLPELTDFTPTGDGRGPLARAKDWLKVDCPKCGGPAERETDTLDTYVDSSFYMLRYFDPHNQEKIFDSKVANKWAPIDFYNGGDHATAHMLYARFVTRFFNKIGLVDNPEPFKQFLFNGKVLASDGSFFSKTKGNGPDPLEIIGQGYGADALRTYLMFAAPLELGSRWDPQGVPGTYRFLNRLWNLVQEFLEAKDQKSSDEPLKATHKMIKKVTEDVEENRYNTAIAAMMECVNDLYKLRPVTKNNIWRQALESLVACVAPFAPFIAEELWQQLGHSTSVHKDSWPKWEERYLAHDKVTIAVQINGKLRGQVEVAAGADEASAVKAAKADEKVKSHLAGKTTKKTIYVPDKLINFVAV